MSHPSNSLIKVYSSLSTYPRYPPSFRLSSSLDFSFLFSGIAKASRLYAGWGATEFANVGFFSDYHLQAWTPERFANGEEILYPALGSAPGTSQKPNDFFIMDRSFLRLKNIDSPHSYNNIIFLCILLLLFRNWYGNINKQFNLGAWSNGRTSVSKTVDTGSIPVAPAICKQRTLICSFFYLILCLFI